MKPANSVVKRIFALNDTFHAVLANPGSVYAMYLYADELDGISLDIPFGRYRIEWVNPRTGAIEKSEEVEHSGSLLDLPYRMKNNDTAIRIVKTADLLIGF
jgi:hypothetical protein